MDFVRDGGRGKWADGRESWGRLIVGGLAGESDRDVWRRLLSGVGSRELLNGGP